jgi:hypothetical protein
MIYLASPYAHPDPKVRKLRVKNITAVARQMIMRGDPVFSPVVYTSQFKIKEFQHEDWLRFDFYFLSISARMLVVPMQGWRESKGIAEEMAYCEANSIPWEMMSDKEFCSLFLADGSMA